ncbi:MAG: hypothetical protein IT432_12090 [Phycisphaerales bacterium]|nr:hypothetical protein [Phycisphaerales bacterium]
MSDTTMTSPDEAALRGDLQSAAFLIGEAEGRWKNMDPGMKFPDVVFMIAAAARPNSPAAFYLKVNCDGYPSRAPTSRLWDHERAAPLALELHPKGSGDVAKVFRIDWPPEAPGSCLYHPMDRRPLSDHGDWPTTYKRQVWHSRRTIVDLLEAVYELLNSRNYTGV